jgi:hypothetical protein
MTAWQVGTVGFHKGNVVQVQVLGRDFKHF